MSSPSENPFRSLIREIHRRSLWQVLGIYLGGSWLAFEIVERIADSAGLPSWIPPFALILLVIGLPVVLATAYVQEGTPDVTSADSLGELDEILAGDEPSRGTRSPLERLFNWRNALLGGAGAFVLLTGVALTWMSVARSDLPASVARAFDEVGDSGLMERSVAVLPFENLSGNPENEYFSDGITEELLNALAQIPGLRVPARTSSFAFKGQNLPIQVIADTLGVAHVLEGSVRRSGDRVLITAQLIDARADRHLWSDSYERQLEDVFVIQREIARAITSELRVTLSSDEEAALGEGGTGSAEAHEAFLRGRFLWNRRTGPSLRAAISEFERATELDPDYAEAWSGLADAYVLLPEYGDEAEPRSWVLQGTRAARRAISLSPDLGMGHASLGWCLILLGDWDGAREELLRAVQLSPGYATAHQWYGYSLYTGGQAAEGVVHSERALELDPVSHVVAANLGRALLVDGRVGEAVARFRETTQFAPSWPTGWIDLALTLLDIGEYQEGAEAWTTAARLLGSDTSRWQSAYQAAVDYRETAEPQTAPELGGSLIVRFAVPFRTGQIDETVTVLRELVRQGTPGYLLGFHAVHSTDRVRANPRYRALLEEAGITW